MTYALASEARAFSGSIIRVVEGQHLITTNRLADSVDDQALLEQLADEAKPTVPPAARHLHWLLKSPFRYGHQVSSRFRHKSVRPGIFYGSEEVLTAIMERVYWILWGFSRSPGFEPPSAQKPHSAIEADIKTGSMIDLLAPPFDADHAQWTHPTDYDACQRLGAAAREAAITLIRAPSARRSDGVNLVVLDPAIFASDPRPHSSWSFLATRDGMLAAQDLERTPLSFQYAEFGLTAP